jgi:hypothetical protein
MEIRNTNINYYCSTHCAYDRLLLLLAQKCKGETAYERINSKDYLTTTITWQTYFRKTVDTDCSKTRRIANISITRKKPRNANRYGAVSKIISTTEDSRI